MKAYFDQLVEFLRKERLRQNEKWGEQHHTPEKWLSIIMEELGEVAEANNDLQDLRFPKESPIRELVQVIAVAFAWLEFDGLSNEGIKHID